VVRTIVIWIFGLPACAIVGGMIGTLIQPPHGDWGGMGALAGVLAFSGLRVWFTADRPKDSQTGAPRDE
jgi:hypothetical protein